ncbi:MAG: hypothetical protein ACRD2T_07095 [Thermoanaerobaculia bacterium]
MSLDDHLDFDPPSSRRRVKLSLSPGLHRRLQGLRASLELRFRIRLGDEDLIEYLCEKALERMEEWERRTPRR